MTNPFTTSQSIEAIRQWRSPAIATLAGVNVLLWAMIAFETARYDDRRYRLRHGLEMEPDNPIGGERTT